MSSRKLVCNITGKTLHAAKQYYDKKIEKAGSEEALHSSYICRDARALLKKGYNVQQIRDALNVSDKFVSTITDEDAKSLSNTSSLRLNNDNQNTIGIIKTDPDVKKFIENILSDE